VNLGADERPIALPPGIGYVLEMRSDKSIVRFGTGKNSALVYTRRKNPDWQAARLATRLLISHDGL